MGTSATIDASPELTPALAEQIAGMARTGIGRAWPYAPQHVWDGAGAGAAPRDLHPIFCGCFDWHSAVHAHWTLARLIAADRLGASEAAAARACLLERITPEAARIEAAYFEHPLRGGFEWPYGWAWLLLLAAELASSQDSGLRAAADALQPLARTLIDRTAARLDRMIAPVRVGTHGNTAFALGLMWDAAPALGRSDLQPTIEIHARRFFGGDRAYPWEYEPSAYDFLSPGLSALGLMRRVLHAHEAPERFEAWLRAYAPGALARGAVALEPVACPDLADGHLSHLVGLNLSRALELGELARALPVGAARSGLAAAADAHRAAGLAEAFSGHYAGDHWLGTFVVHLLTGRGTQIPPGGSGSA